MALDASREVTAIVTNWKRPGNIPLIVDALAGQSVRPNIVLVDNGDSLSLVRPFPQDMADEYWRFPARSIISRFAPALIDLQSEYTLFLDDDLLPGPRCVENLLVFASAMKNRFATIGQIGRIYHRPMGTTLHYEYRRRNVKCNSETGVVRVDLTCRGHFVLTRMLQMSVAKWMSCVASSGFVPVDVVRGNDDICLCQSIQREPNYNLPSYIVPMTPETAIRARDLPSGGDGVAASAGEDFVKKRTDLINAFANLGWVSFV